MESGRGAFAAATDAMLKDLVLKSMMLDAEEEWGVHTSMPTALIAHTCQNVLEKGGKTNVLISEPRTYE